MHFFAVDCYICFSGWPHTPTQSIVKYQSVHFCVMVNTTWGTANRKQGMIHGADF